MDFSLDKLEYDLFLAEQTMESAQLEKYVNECILMGSGTDSLTAMKTLNEGFVDTVKNVINKILAGIAKMWNSFLEATNTLIKTDKGYLEKYKDIILKKQATDATFTMYNYNNGGLDKIIRATVPAFHYSEMKQHLDTDENFQSKYFGHYMQSGSKAEFSDQIKTTFRGSAEEIDIKASQLNMTDLYNYCYNYKNLVANIEKDTKSIQDAGIAAVRLIDDMVKKGEMQRESGNIFEKGQYYSDIYRTFVTEMDIKPGEQSTPAAATTPNNQTEPSTNPAKANQNIEKREGDKETDQQIQDKAKTGEGTEKTAKENTERINRYLRICGIFLGAKLSIAQSIYKDYMIIIKFHVRQHLGDKKDATTSKAADVASTYDKDGKPVEKPTEPSKDGKPAEPAATDGKPVEKPTEPTVFKKLGDFLGITNKK